jgi:hypothetical protein
MGGGGGEGGGGSGTWSGLYVGSNLRFSRQVSAQCSSQTPPSDVVAGFQDKRARCYQVSRVLVTMYSLIIFKKIELLF